MCSFAHVLSKATCEWRENPGSDSTHCSTPADPEVVYKKLPPVCTSGGAFLRKFARLSNGEGGDDRDRQWKCAFCLTRDGRVVKVQRTIFSECFYVLALDELSRVTGDHDMQVDHQRPSLFRKGAELGARLLPIVITVRSSWRPSR